MGFLIEESAAIVWRGLMASLLLVYILCFIISTHVLLLVHILLLVTCTIISTHVLLLVHVLLLTYTITCTIISTHVLLLVYMFYY